MTTDLFMEACGARGPLYLEVEGEGREHVERRLFSQPFALIGRDARADLLLDHARVSRRHAYLQVIDGHVFCVDLGSRTGVRWDDDRRRARSGWMRACDNVSIGPFVLRLPTSDRGDHDHAEEWADPADPFQVQTPGPVSLPDIVLEFRDRGGESPLTRWRMTRRLALVGNAPECQVRFRDKSVSRFHCGLLRTPMGLWAVDLLGRDGIAVNEKGVNVARLVDGDELKIGRVTIDVRYEAANSPDKYDEQALPEGRVLVKPEGNPPPRSGSEDVMLPENTTTRPASFPVNFTGVRGSLSVGGGWAPSDGERHEAAGFGDPSLPLLVDQMLLMNQSMMESFGRTVMMMFQEIKDLHSDELRLLREELDRVRQLSSELTSLKADRALAPPPEAHPPGVKTSVDRKGDAGAKAPPAVPVPSPETAESAIPPVRPKIPARSAGKTEDAQDWLCERIAALQNEQESRWHKVLKLLQSKSETRRE